MARKPKAPMSDATGANGDPVGDPARSQSTALVALPPEPEAAPAKPKSALAVGALAIGSFALGALALGVVAIGALAVGRLSIGKAKIGRTHLRRLEIDELIIRRLITPHTDKA